MFKLKNATRDIFFRLRKNQYGSAKHWVALAAKPPSAAAKAAKKAKPKAKPKPAQGPVWWEVGRRAGQ